MPKRSMSLETKLDDVSEWLGAGTLNFFGMPFAGKDTQAGKLSQRWDVPVIGGGEILRNSVIPPDVRASMDRGEIIRSDVYRQIVLPFLGQSALQGRPMLLSSVGRMAGEEPGVLAATEAAGHPTMAVPYLEISEDEMLRRHALAPSRGRADDDPAVMGRRLAAYQEQTVPVLQTYDKEGLLVPVNAMEEPDLVFRALVHELHDRAMAA